MIRSDALRLAVDIGGTFTDVALVHRGGLVTAKVLTTPRAPEQAVLRGVAQALERAGATPADVAVFVHGTTLATNALIERKGACTALITTQGFRDSLEMAYEHRFEQYDIWMDRPAPLVPRTRRFTVPERLDAKGNVLVPLDEAAVAALIPQLRAAGAEAVAVGFLHSYVNARHELRVGEILADLAPDLWVTLSSAICPEMREYERISTACANAYVQPVMAGYLGRLDTALRAGGFDCPLVLMTSGGGLTGLDSARARPVRLVESGPAGGAILAARLADQLGEEKVLSFDMGGTTAKLCLIEDGRPLQSRSFEVAREYRFLKGSGLPLRIPVIEMVEIGAGGGSIATVDAMARIRVGPASAGSEPGPACYGLGGSAPTVTDANLVLGRLDPEGFADGSMQLDVGRATVALEADLGRPLGMAAPDAAWGLIEIVDENMANAARVHAVERGAQAADRTMIAFGGAAPLHAARLADKLGIDRVVIPAAAGVGSALGFLLAPVTYETARSHYCRLDALAAEVVNARFDEMRAEALAVIRDTVVATDLREIRTADMRYAGQGHEIVVQLPARPLRGDDAAALHAAFQEAYLRQYDRLIPDLPVEVLSWALRLEAPAPEIRTDLPEPPETRPDPQGWRMLRDPQAGAGIRAALHDRAALAPGSVLDGPAIVAEAHTTAVVPAGRRARIDRFGHILMERIA